MRIVVTGGGSGGHITPVLVVAHELKAEKPDIEVIYIGHKGDSLGDIPAQDKNIDQVFYVRAGKLRRYHGEGLKQLLDLHTVYLNIKDIFNVLAGIWESFWLLKKLNPGAIFIKGGFVGLPIGISAAVLRIPFITHDSDAMPGLANRVIAPWARIHTVALPKDSYDYPADKTITVGVPLSKEYHPLKLSEITSVRKSLGLEKFKKIVLITGGGLGAQRINKAVVACVPDLLSRYDDLGIVHITGRKDEPELRHHYKSILSDKDQKRVITRGFVTDLYHYSAASDVIVTRAGATAIAEFAAQAKACIVIPSPFLAGGHQLKNAKVLESRKTVKMINEVDLQVDPLLLMAPLVNLLDNPDIAHHLGEKLSHMARLDAAHRIAMLLLDIANGKKIHSQE